MDGLGSARRERAAAWRDSRTEPTRLVFGMTCLLVGYHIAAYVLPATWLPFHVPIENAWMLGAGLLALNIGSVLIDRMQATSN
jgi:hypothetical protein